MGEDQIMRAYCCRAARLMLIAEKEGKKMEEKGEWGGDEGGKREGSFASYLVDRVRSKRRGRALRNRAENSTNDVLFGLRLLAINFYRVTLSFARGDERLEIRQCFGCTALVLLV
jgi:hypothetical protein